MCDTHSLPTEIPLVFCTPHVLFSSFTYFYIYFLFSLRDGFYMFVFFILSIIMFWMFCLSVFHHHKLKKLKLPRWLADHSIVSWSVYYHKEFFLSVLKSFLSAFLFHYSRILHQLSKINRDICVWNWIFSSDTCSIISTMAQFIPLWSGCLLMSCLNTLSILS